MPCKKSRFAVATTGFVQDIEIGSHRLLGDEPTNLGGSDRGPSPYDFLLAALGSCTSMTLRMYADRKEWPLKAVTVRLRHDKMHARDCEDCESKMGRLESHRAAHHSRGRPGRRSTSQALRYCQ